MEASSWAVAVALCGAAILSAEPQQEVERRVNGLLARMTLDEKIGQMSQSTAMATPLSDQIKAEIHAGRWGSFLNAGSPADRAEAQRIAMRESRLGIPLLFGRDVIHGYKTVFPIPLGQAATWDMGLVEEAAREAAREASTEGIRWTFAPMVDIARDPRWGRVAESLGEDPYLGSKLAAAMVRGFQGQSLADSGSIAACAKHFAGYGAAEGGRDYNSAWIPEILLREVYLQPFRAVREAGVASFMTAFNTLNGVPATGDRFLLRDILRGEWEYDGLVVSDYNAITEMIEHGYARDASEAAREAVTAGVDMEMVSTAYFDHLKPLVASGAVIMAEIDSAVRDILRLKFRLGLFDQAIPAPAEFKPDRQALALAERAAVESAVLLKNEGGLLPLSAAMRSVAIIGPLADSPADQIGTWSMDGRLEYVETPLAAFRKMPGGVRVVYARGLRNSRDTSHDGFAEAVDAARRADVVLLFLGEEAILSGEARSRAFLGLPGAQEALVDAVHTAGKPMVAVIMAGRPLTFEHVAAEAGAVLYMWHPGTMGGPAIANLLVGQTSPSGRLPVTFPRTVGQVPIYYEDLNTGRPPLESDLGIPLGNPTQPEGYTSKYIDVDFTPAYPFGFGLTYTRVRATLLEPACVGTGTRGRWANHGIRRDCEPWRALSHRNGAVLHSGLGSERGTAGAQTDGLRASGVLGPGESRTVSFRISPADLTFYNKQVRLVTEPGPFFKLGSLRIPLGGLRGEFELR